MTLRARIEAVERRLGCPDRDVDEMSLSDILQELALITTPADLDELLAHSPHDEHAATIRGEIEAIWHLRATRGLRVPEAKKAADRARR